MILLGIITGVLTVLVIALSFTCAKFDARNLALEGYVKYLEGRILAQDAELKTLPSGIQTKSPVLDRCNAMVLMASQSSDEEARTAAQMACSIIVDNELDIVKLS